MSTIGISTNAATTATALAALDDTIGTTVPAVTRAYGEILRTRVRANATGRPGPNVQTGDYRRSIALEVTAVIGGDATATVGTNAPQARRLEYGFMNMRDSLGRLYHQPPLPHFGPALEQTAPEYLAALAQAVNVAIDKGGRSS